ncbi:formate/nitrite transporter family protein [Solibacillus sp. MA9]|uniref:Formate/nitrite transporter family protein n=1 Tax=Solibacillus palustris TaxID=2908203 RepID=A0ABS9UFW5_9BACL|nr:formate/nitrite transporter family protein [Solibacillus sp. MA9]MCH7322810.1 formate/nitrite transporter family protein [Solibacillus sp. MA9]
MNETFQAIVAVAQKKVNIVNRSVFSYLMLALLGGLFIGFGMLTFIVIGGMLTPAEVPYVKIIQAAVFGIALCMVMLGGVDLFTGNNLVMTIGALEKRTSWLDLVKVWIVSYGGNFVGAYLCAWLLVMTGYVVGDLAAYVEKVTHLKTSASFSELLFRGIYCNVLVCLAVWCTYRVKSETAKIALIFCCIFPFILGGFEHSIANMMVFSVASMIPQGAVFSIDHFFHNLIPVTIGNALGGALLGVAFWLTETGNREY